MRTATLDRRLLWVTLALMTFGLLTLYSAGQTDVPTHAAGVWTRQFFWFGIGTVAGWVVFHTSLRLLEWLAPALYAFSIALLGIVLVVGGIMEFAEHGTTVAPYVIRALRRYILGPDTVGTIKVKVLLDEAISPADTAPRPVELDPDSAAVRAQEDSVRRAGERP